MNLISFYKSNNALLLLSFFVLPFIAPNCSPLKNDRNISIVVDTTIVDFNEYDALYADDQYHEPELSTNFFISPDGKNFSAIGYLLRRADFGYDVLLVLIVVATSFYALFRCFLFRFKDVFGIDYFISMLGEISLVLFGISMDNFIVYGYGITLILYSLNFILLIIIARKR